MKVLVTCSSSYGDIHFMDIYANFLKDYPHETINDHDVIIKLNTMEDLCDFYQKVKTFVDENWRGSSDMGSFRGFLFYGGRSDKGTKAAIEIYDDYIE